MKYMKLLFTTVHPAPYFDRLFSFFSQKDVDVEAWYEFSKVEEKNWKTYHSLCNIRTGNSGSGIHH